MRYIVLGLATVLSLLIGSIFGYILRSMVEEDLRAERKARGWPPVRKIP
jgi:hypothetical protein